MAHQCVRNGLEHWQDQFVQMVEPEAVEWSNFVYAIHHAEHARLDSKQRLAVQHYAESVQRLVRRRDHYRSLIDDIPKTPLGLGLRPNADLQDELYDSNHTFFEQTYSAIGAMASVHGRIKVFGEDPPIGSVERFLSWWEARPPFFMQEAAAQELRKARDFRTLLAHPQQQVVFDWSTRSNFYDRSIAVVLHGEPSSKGRIPAGASVSPIEPARWEFVSPNMSVVLHALLTLTSMTFHTMAGTFPLSPEEETCTWEADGFGSAPHRALEKMLSERVRSDPEVSRLWATPPMQDD